LLPQQYAVPAEIPHEWLSPAVILENAIEVAMGMGVVLLIVGVSPSSPFTSFPQQYT
jgi:hypothetical protein